MSEPIRICTPVHGDDFERMFQVFKDVHSVRVPEATIIPYRYSPPPRYKHPEHAGDWAKACATSLHATEEPLFVMDVDAIMVRPTYWSPQSESTMLIMSCTEGFDPGDNKGILLMNDAMRHVGLLDADETIEVNPQFFWANGNLLPIYEDLEIDLSEYANTIPDDSFEYMWSLTLWAMVFKKLENEGKAEHFAKQQPVWHCPMLKDRFNAYRIFSEWVKNQPMENPQFPPMSIFPVKEKKDGCNIYF